MFDLYFGLIHDFSSNPRTVINAAIMTAKKISMAIWGDDVSEAKFMVTLCVLCE
jgi:hypothetical protein